MAHKITPAQFEKLCDSLKKTEIPLSDEARAIEASVAVPPEFFVTGTQPKNPKPVYKVAVTRADPEVKPPVTAAIVVHGANRAAIRINVPTNAELDGALRAMGFDPANLPVGLGGEAPTSGVREEGRKPAKKVPKA